jgi:hypothetical protein
MLVRTVGLRISLLSLLCLYEGSALATDAASPPSSAYFGTPPDPKALVTLASQGQHDRGAVREAGVANVGGT